MPAQWESTFASQTSWHLATRATSSRRLRSPPTMAIAPAPSSTPTGNQVTHTSEVDENDAKPKDSNHAGRHRQHHHQHHRHHGGRPSGIVRLTAPVSTTREVVNQLPFVNSKTRAGFDNLLSVSTNLPVLMHDQTVAEVSINVTRQPH